jgi:DNA-binding SARP family transcriptional activator
MSLRIRLLGPPTLERDGQRVALEGRKTWALLAFVILESPAPTRRQLAERLWSEADDPLGAMRWTLSQVRKFLAPDATIAEEHDRLSLVGEFRVDAADLLNGTWHDDTIDDVTRGELLEGTDAAEAPEFERWLSVQRARVATARIDALRSCAAGCLRSDPLRALQLAERALASEPFDDGLHELVVGCHIERGDIAAATRYVETADALYRRELGVPIPPRLRRAVERRRADPSLPLLSLDLKARVLLETARARSAAGAYDDARDMTTRAIDAAATSGDRALEVRGILSFLNIATCQMSRGAAEWNPLLQQAFALATDLGDPILLCDVEMERGRLAAIEGRFGAAEAMLRRGLAVARELDDDLRIATARRLLGVSETERCDYDAAEQDLRAAALHPERRAAAMAYLARLLVLTGKGGEVEEIADAADLWSSADGIIWAPLALIASGQERLARGELVAASERFGSALVMARETSDTDWTVLALRGLAHVDRADGRPERAMGMLRQSLEMASAHRGCRRWCEAVVLADLVEWEKGADRAHVERGLHLAHSSPMPDVAARLAPFARARTALPAAAS